MATNYEIFSGLQEMSYTQALRWGQFMLQSGESWGPVWDIIKERFPSISAEQLDRDLNKDTWHEAGAYQQWAEENKEQLQRAPAWDQDGINWLYQLHLARHPEKNNLTPGQKEAMRYSLYWQFGVMPDKETIPVAPEEVPATITPPAEKGQVLDREQAALMLDGWFGDIAESMGENVPATLKDPTWWTGMDYNTANSLMQQTSQNYHKRVEDTKVAEEQVRQQKMENSWKVLDAGAAGWYFPRDEVLLKFVDGDPTPSDDTTSKQTVWLYNKNNNTAIPFFNEEAFNNYFTGIMDLTQAAEMGRINMLSSDTLFNRATPFYKADLLRADLAIQPDGSIPEETQIIWSYGQKTNQATDDAAMNWVENFLDLVDADPNVGVSKETIAAIRGDETAKQKLAVAVSFGGYGVGDAYRFLRSKELAAQGYTDYNNFKAFDGWLPAQDWYKTEEGQTALSDEVFNVPQSIAGIDASLLGNSFMFESPDYFESPLAFLEYGSDEWNAEVEKIDSQFYDVAMQQISADTDRAKAIADDNWRLLKESVEKRYGIELSNNALQAWDQVKALRENFAQRGIPGSGMEEYERDSMLHKVRRSDELLREQEDKDLEVEERNYYLNSASDQQIYDLIKNEPEKAERWGFIPNDEQKAWFSLDAIKARYEGISDEDAQRLQDTFLVTHPDGTVHFRSVLFQNESEALEDTRMQSIVAKEAELMRQRNEYREKMEKERDPATLEGYDKTPEDTSTARIQTGGVPPEEYSPTGEWVRDPAKLPEYHRKLQAAGIPQDKWGDYIKKVEGEGDKLFFFDPKQASRLTYDTDISGAPSAPAPSVPAGSLAFYRDPNSKDIYNASTGQRIGSDDWKTNWAPKGAKEVPYQSTYKTETIKPYSSFASSSFESKTAPTVKNQEAQKYTAAFSKEPSASDSRFWSMNPDRESNLQKLKTGEIKF